MKKPKVHIIQKHKEVFNDDETLLILEQRKQSSGITDGELQDFVIFNDGQLGREWGHIFQLIDTKLAPVLSDYYKQFYQLLPSERISISHIGFLNDHSGSFTELHYDWEFVKLGEELILKPFVVLIYLSHVEEGGDLLFPLQELTFQPERNSVLILPCHYSYPHLSMPVTVGHKHICRVTYRIDSKCYEVDELEI